jgi:proton-translocating NADH-quinone oxidoreductase chain N
MPSLLILLPLLMIIIINLPFGRIFQKSAFWVALAIFVADMVFVIHPFSFVQTQLSRIDSFFAIDFKVNYLSFVVLFSIGIVTLASLIVSRSTIADERQRFKFINLLLISFIGMNGTILATDVFTLYIYLEITTIASFILMAMDKGLAALEGAFKYILLSGLATILILFSIALFFLAVGDTSFAALAGAIRASNGNPVLNLAVVLFLAGLFIKGGLVPFHGWLPDAYTESPAPVSVLLGGIVTKVGGVYTLIRIVTEVFGFHEGLKTALLVLGSASILVGAFAALTQTNFKKMLSFSSISQVGYIIVGLATGTQMGITGAVFHLFSHSVFKALLFVNAAAVEKQASTLNMDELGGLSSRMPVTGATSVVALLSAGGLPPLAGFWSKLIIIIALWNSGNIVFALIAILAGVVTLGYLLVLQRKVFFGKIREGLEQVKEAAPGILAVSVALSLLNIFAVLFFPLILNTYGAP